MGVTSALVGSGGSKKGWNQGRREALLKKFDIVDKELLADLRTIRDFRNQHVHDVFAREGIKRKEELYEYLSDLLNKIDNVVTSLFSFFIIPIEELAKYGSEKWLNSRTDICKHKVGAEPEFHFVSNHENIYFDDLYWEDRVGVDKRHNFYDESADFSELSNERIGMLHEFADRVNKHLEDDIVENINWRPRNITKRDLCILILLEGDTDYDKIANIFPTTPRYIKRKEVVLYDKISKSNADWLGIEQCPDLEPLESDVDWYKNYVRNPLYENWELKK